MKFLTGLLVGVLVCVLLGAGQPTDEYSKACLGVMAENVAAGTLAKEPARYAASLRRLQYWIGVMEKFKP